MLSDLLYVRVIYNIYMCLYPCNAGTYLVVGMFPTLFDTPMVLLAERVGVALPQTNPWLIHFAHSKLKHVLCVGEVLGMGLNVLLALRIVSDDKGRRPGTSFRTAVYALAPLGTTITFGIYLLSRSAVAATHPRLVLVL